MFFDTQGATKEA